MRVSSLRPSQVASQALDARGGKRMRTHGRLFVGCEVDPGLKERIQAAARARNVSEATVVRDVLVMVFSSTQDDMGRYGGSGDE